MQSLGIASFAFPCNFVFVFVFVMAMSRHGLLILQSLGIASCAFPAGNNKQLPFQMLNIAPRLKNRRQHLRFQSCKAEKRGFYGNFSTFQCTIFSFWSIRIPGELWAEHLIFKTPYCFDNHFHFPFSTLILGKLAKQIFGKSWEFGPRRGAGVWPNPNFFSKLTKT